jgi:hypothetical protein
MFEKTMSLALSKKTFIAFSNFEASPLVCLKGSFIDSNARNLLLLFTVNLAPLALTPMIDYRDYLYHFP